VPPPRRRIVLALSDTVVVHVDEELAGCGCVVVADFSVATPAPRRRVVLALSDTVAAHVDEELAGCGSVVVADLIG